MANSNTVTLTFAGDARQLQQATQQVGASTQQMAGQVGQSSNIIIKSFDKLTAGATFLTDGLSGLGDAVDSFSDLSRAGAIRADALARKQLDVAQAAQDLSQALADARQAQIDLNQSQADAVQAGLDVEQAMLDAEQAQNDYNSAVAEFGENSIEARQAALDLKQANADLTQAQVDAQQATEDQNQAQLDLSQSAIDAKDAQISLNEASREASAPNAVQEWADRLSDLSAILFTVVGAVQLFSTVSSLAAVKQGIVSAATAVWTSIQWLLNLALTANPIGIIIVAIGALIAIIVLIATKTTWFQDIWNAAWSGIKAAAAAVWDWLKGAWEWLGNAFDWLVGKFQEIPDNIKAAFSGLWNIITAPFRAAFNAVSDLWNNTIGRLRWSVPDWVPFIGGNTISVPQLPHFHTGGVVPGAPGQEMLAVLQAGETVTPAGQSAGTVVLEIRSGGSDVDDLLVKILSRAVKARGGNVQLALGR